LEQINDAIRAASSDEFIRVAVVPT
jgi:hypothetical protein